MMHFICIFVIPFVSNSYFISLFLGWHIKGFVRVTSFRPSMMEISRAKFYLFHNFLVDSANCEGEKIDDELFVSYWSPFSGASIIKELQFSSVPWGRF